MAQIKINERLNLVVPIFGSGDSITAYVFSTPITRETFEASVMLVSKTFATINGQGLGAIAGPRIAKLIMERVANQTEEQQAYFALMAEIRRLTNVMVATPNGWQMVPFQAAIDDGTIDQDDLGEVENAIVYFTVASAMHTRRVLKSILPGAVTLWGAFTTSSDIMTFGASLRTLTAKENTGEPPKLNPEPDKPPPPASTPSLAL